MTAGLTGIGTETETGAGRRRLSARGWALVALAGFAALNLQLFGVAHPPLVDWPNHLARHAIHCAAPGFDGQAAYYDFGFRIVPNLAGDLLHALEAPCRDLLLTRALLVQWASLGLVVGVFALHRAIWGRLSAWPLMAGFVAHNMALDFGFENYVVAAAAVPWALALWVVLERRAPRLLLPVFVPLMAGLYLMHLYAFGFLGAVLGGRALGQAWAARRRGATALWPVLRLALAGALPLGHLAVLTAASAGLEPGNTAWGDPVQKTFALLSPILPATFQLDPPPLFTLLLGTALVPLLAWVALHRAGRPAALAPGWGPALLAAGALTLAMPTILDGIWYSDIRFPTLFLCLLVAVTDPRPDPRQLRLLVPVLLAALALRTGTIAQDWRAHDREMAALIAVATAELGPGDRLVTASVGEDDRRIYRHANSAPLLGAVTGAHVPTLFHGANTLQPKPEVGSRAAAQGLMPEISDLLAGRGARGRPLPAYLRDWRGYYSHLLLLGPVAGAPPLPGATPVAREEWFVLYRLDGG